MSKSTYIYTTTLWQPVLSLCEKSLFTLCLLGDLDDEEESPMVSADDQRESDFQVIIVILCHSHD